MNNCRWTDTGPVQGDSMKYVRGNKLWDKALVNLLSYAVFGGNLTTIRLPYLWETGT